ncbi:MAG: hypothetical protein MUE60_07005, partial [Candidatus Eisenbacteria bacterium]|nr:hypothetical protein [Candidatus Eisenbacteria bacterium]
MTKRLNRLPGGKCRRDRPRDEGWRPRAWETMLTVMIMVSPTAGSPILLHGPHLHRHTQLGLDTTAVIAPGSVIPSGIELSVGKGSAFIMVAPGQILQ